MNQTPVAIVAGSGMEIESVFHHVEETVSFRDVPSMPLAGVAGHAGHFVRGKHENRMVFMQCGRPHMYEGHAPSESARGVDVMAGWGAQTFIFLNAVGGLLKTMGGGELIAVDEVWTWPFTSHPLPSLQKTDLLLDGCDMTGPCVWMHGPCYETHAEIALLRASGAVAVGMSLAAEVARCHELGVRCAAVSCVANVCGAPIAVTHTEVLNTMRRTTPRILNCLHRTLDEI